jgi:hypothetical protein
MVWSSNFGQTCVSNDRQIADFSAIDRGLKRAPVMVRCLLWIMAKIDFGNFSTAKIDDHQTPTMGKQLATSVANNHRR